MTMAARMTRDGTVGGDALTPAAGVAGLRSLARLALVMAASAGGVEAAADDLPMAIDTPEARVINVALDRDGMRARGFVVGGGEPWRLGVVVVCEKATGRIEGHLSFGPFPADRPVQAAVRRTDGTVERFGQVVVTEHGGRSGFHSPVIRGRDDVLRLMTAAFREGSLISNGRRSVWNRIPAAGNARARDDILTCAG